MKRNRVVATGRLHLWLMLTLTFSTGVIDAVGYLGLDRVFTGNMTGNVVLLGMAVAGDTNLPSLRLALAVSCFMIGAAIAGRLLRKQPGGWSGWVSLNLLVVSIGTAGIAVYVATVDVHSSDLLASLVTGGLAMVMGTQAATARHIKVAEITTVVVTSTITGLAADSWLAGGKGKHWARRTLAITLIGLGALVGAAALLIDLWVGIAVASAVSFTVTTVGHLRYRRDKRDMAVVNSRPVPVKLRS